MRALTFSSTAWRVLPTCIRLSLAKHLMLAKSAASRARRRARIFALSFLILFYITCAKCTTGDTLSGTSVQHAERTTVIRKAKLIFEDSKHLCQ